MSLIRKVFWPSAVALGLLVFLGAIGQGNALKTAQAFPGDICAIDGPRTVTVGSKVLYRVAVEDPDEGLVLEVEISDQTGNGDITSIAEPSDDYENINATNSVGDLEVGIAGEDDDDFDTWDEDFWLDINADAKLSPDATVCGRSTRAALIEFIDRSGFCPNFIGEQLSVAQFFGCVDFSATSTVVNDPPSAAQITAIVNAIDTQLNAGEIDCDAIGDAVEDALIDLGGMLESEAGEADLAIQEWCMGDQTMGVDWPSDGFAFFDVTCVSAGTYQISAFDQFEADNAMSIQVTCLGYPTSASTIAALPASVEIVPAPGNVAHSLIVVTLLDAAGNSTFEGIEVQFTTDRCSIEAVAAADVAAARTLFNALNVNVPSTAAAIEASAFAAAAPDATPTVDLARAVVITTPAPADSPPGTASTSVTRAAAVLHCDPQHAVGATPGVANVIATIGAPGTDVILSTRVTVVGPPASITVAASPTTVRCGEKATITATVKDAIGQNVSEHTRVEAITNAGGVLAGTGAVANQAGLVTPISSTVAETFSGVATFFLLTSEQHTGAYEVVVTSGGTGALGSALGGVFSTAPVSAQATVTCTLPQAAAPAAPTASVTAPRTGTGGITPPNTGEAGLAASNGSSWTLFAVAGVVALTMAAGYAFKRGN